MAFLKILGIQSNCSPKTIENEMSGAGQKSGFNFGEVYQIIIDKR